MNFGVLWFVAAAVTICGAEKWQWPEQAASVRIDTKVRFTDDGEHQIGDRPGVRVQVHDDEVPFQEASDTNGFYNRPCGVGRYPVLVEPHPYQIDSTSIYSLHNYAKNINSDGTLDSLQYCRCMTTPDCNPRHDSARACGSGKFLCCYKRPNKIPQQNTEFFNEIEDERPSLLPGRENLARPFPPPPNGNLGYDGPFENAHAHDSTGRGPGVLVGPVGSTGNIGNPGVLVGPGGPSGVIGPYGPETEKSPKRQNVDVLVGPEGPTGIIGPAPINQNKEILIGPGGPREVGSSETAQRGVLVGPGGPTGVIGPRGYNQRPVLVGPGGPTGIIGPGMREYFNQFFGRQRRPGVLVGPGGPTGQIGPGRQLLVGPGGPTGHIGPLSYFG